MASEPDGVNFPGSGVKAGWSEPSQDYGVSESDGVNHPTIKWRQSRME